MIVNLVEDVLELLRRVGTHLDAGEARIALPLTDADVFQHVGSASRQDFVEDFGQQQRVDDMALISTSSTNPGAPEVAGSMTASMFRVEMSPVGLLYEEEGRPEAHLTAISPRRMARLIVSMSVFSPSSFGVSRIIGRVRKAVIEQQAERFQPDLAAADVRMAVHAAAERLAAVVDMEEPQPLRADQPIEGAERGSVLRLRMQAIARGEDVAGIETDAEPIRIADHLEDAGQVLELMAEAAPLSRRRLQQDLDAKRWTTGVYLIQRRCHFGKTRLLTAVDVRAGMRHEIAEAELLGPLDFDDKRLKRSAIEGLIRRGEIDEIGIVRRRIRSPLCRRARRKVRTSSSVSSRAAHWLAFLVKSFSDWKSALPAGTALTDHCDGLDVNI